MVQKIEINLLPAEYRVHTKRPTIKKEVAIPLFIDLVIFLTIILVSGYQSNQISTYNRNIAQVEAEIKANQKILNEINKLKKKRELVQKKITGLQRINVNREKWVKLQEEFCKSLPEESWITTISENKDSSSVINISGKTYVFSEVAQFMSRLEKSEYVNSVELGKIMETNNGIDKIFDFDIICKLNQNIKLSSVNKDNKG